MLVGSGQKIKQTQQQLKNITENKKEQSKFVKGNIFPQSFVYEFLMIDGYPLPRTKLQDSFSTTKLRKNLDFGVVIWTGISDYFLAFYLVHLTNNTFVYNFITCISPKPVFCYGEATRRKASELFSRLQSSFLLFLFATIFLADQAPTYKVFVCLRRPKSLAHNKSKNWIFSLMMFVTKKKKRQKAKDKYFLRWNLKINSLTYQLFQIFDYSPTIVSIGINSSPIEDEIYYQNIHPLQDSMEIR